MIELTAGLIVFLFPLAYSPGPGNLFFAANGARFGARATWPASFGYHTATFTVALAIGLSFAATIENVPTALAILKYLGSGYVLYLALTFIRSGAFKTTENARPAGFFDGVMLLVLNPKAYVIVALMFSQFLTSVRTDYFAMVLWLSFIFTINNLIAFWIWAVVGDQIAAQFRNDDNARKLNIIFGLMLAGVAIWMAIA